MHHVAGRVALANPPVDGEAQIEIVERCDANDIETALLSLSSPGVYFGDEVAATSLARRCNEELAAVVSARPDRFGAFAVLPPPAPSARVPKQSMPWMCSGWTPSACSPAPNRGIVRVERAEACPFQPAPDRSA